MNSDARQPRLRKSRTGCTSCRVRKVKCDELRPVCGNCSRRFVESQACEYAGAPPPRRSAQTKNHEQLVKRSLALRPSTMRPDSQWRSLELRLMHHYTSVVSQTMPNCNGDLAKDMWARLIPQHAFDSSIVLDAMLALSALHLHAHSPNDTHMSLVISNYIDRTLVNHRIALKDYDGELTEQIWLSAVILSNMYWLLAHQSRPGEAYELPLTAWNMMSGVTTLFKRKYTVLQELGYDWYGYMANILTIPTNDLSHESRKHLAMLESDLRDLFGAFNVRTLPEDEQLTYVEARACIMSVYQGYFSGTETRVLRMFIGTMPIQCTPTYRKLLESHDPLAMALLARLLVLLVPLTSIWWMDGAGDYEVVHRDVLGICELMPDDRLWCMKWPCRVLSGDITLGR